jgi:hypothetical protein
MSIDEILNGRFEIEAREALNKLQLHCPPGYLPKLYTHVQLGGNSFAGVEYAATGGCETVGNTYSTGSLLEAAEKCIATTTGPEAIAKRRQELTAKLQAIEAELSALPAPAPAPEAPTIVPAETAAA